MIIYKYFITHIYFYHKDIRQQRQIRNMFDFRKQISIYDWIEQIIILLMSNQILSTKTSTSQIPNDQITKQLQLILQPYSSSKNQIQDNQVESMIRSHLQQSYCKQPKKLKSRSVATLNASIVNRYRIQQQSLERRFSDKRQQMSAKIHELQKQCEKYGGADFMKAELIRNKITRQEQFDYYKQKIQSIHGSLSLPRIERARGQSSSENKLGPINNHQNSAINKTKAANRFNKWYIEPSKRFSPEELNVNQYNKQSNVTKYVQKMLSRNNKNVQVKYPNAPEIIKEWSLKLGRDPLICSYAQIRRR